MKFTREDLDWAVSSDVIDQDRATRLWTALAARPSTPPQFDLAHVAYYAGALLVIGAMGWFMGEAWERFGGFGLFSIAIGYAAAFLICGAVFWQRPELRTPGGLLVTLAVCMTPLAVYGLQRWLGIWGFDDPGIYRDFHRWIRGGWFTMEVPTILAGLLALRFVKFPFLTAPIAFVLWYLTMDLAPIIAGSDGAFSWELRKQISLWFGLGMLAVAYLVDRCSKLDFAFWGYLFGVIAFWGGLSLMHSDSELSKFIYFVINTGLVGAAIFLHRRVFIVFGGLGICGYTGHLAFRVFVDSLLFPFALTLIGLAILGTGIAVKRYEAEIKALVDGFMPPWLAQLRPAERGAPAA